MVPLISEKFPCRISAVGTVAIGLNSVSARTPSYAAVKKVLLRPSKNFGNITGPSSSNPNWLRRRGFLGIAGFSKNPRSSSASSWKNSNSEPCGVLVPLLVTTLMWTPRYAPYSADVLPVWT